MKDYLWIGFGSALGGMARYGMTVLVSLRFGDAFPWATIAINAIGSFLIGLLAAFATQDGHHILSLPTKEFLITGFLGGFTTFSAFSLQTLTLARHGQTFQAAGNVALSIALCLVAVWVGHALGQWWNR